MTREAGLLVVCEQELAWVATACQVSGELPAAHGEAGSGRDRIPAWRAEVSGIVGSQVEKETGEFTGRMLGVLAAYAGPVRCRQVVRGRAGGGAL